MRTCLTLLLMIFFLALPSAEAEARYYDTDYGAEPAEDSTIVECVPARHISRQVSYYEKKVAKDLRPLFPEVRVKIRTYNKTFTQYQPIEEEQTVNDKDIALIKTNLTGNLQKPKLKACKIILPVFVAVRADLGQEYVRASFRKVMTVNGFQADRHTKQVHVAMANYKPARNN